LLYRNSFIIHELVPCTCNDNPREYGNVEDESENGEARNWWPRQSFFLLKRHGELTLNVLALWSV